MKMRHIFQGILFFFMSFFAISLQASILTIPIVLGILIAFTVVRKKLWILLIAFVLGFVCDSVLLRSPGLESLFFMLVVIFIFLYERKFETATKEFVGIFSFIAGFIYCLLFPSSGLLVPAVAVLGIGIGSFFVFNLLE